MDVSVIIVSYNACELLENTIRSVIEHTKAVSYEIIVVDNDSKDGSLEMVKSLFADVKAIESGENLGFGRANNLGAEYAKGDYLFFLNSDTLLRSDAISELYDYAVSHKQIGAVGAKLLQQDGVTPNLSWGYFPSPKAELRYIWTKLRGCNYCETSAEEPFAVDFISGADLMVERSYFGSLGGFDRNIFLYYEETDLQKRMDYQNRSRIILPSIGIIHLEGGSFGRAGLTFNRFCNSQTSYNYYIRKHFSGVKYLLFRLFVSLIRLEVFLGRKNWTLSQRFKAYRTVLSSATSKAEAGR